MQGKEQHRMSLGMNEIRERYLRFFESKGHARIPGAPLVPENDPTVLFTTAGMHPLVPFLMGEPHPAGKRLTNCQICLRTNDIEEVGDENHLTFFEMLGNWSLGDYFKREAITWTLEFFTRELGIPMERLAVTCFEGDEDAPRDEEAASIWEELGIPRERIFFLSKEHNWWGPAGQTGPCGPDTEIFYITDKPPCCAECSPACSCGTYIEIGNDVFMQYNKKADGTFEPLSQKNVDFGGGLERITTVLAGKSSVFEMEPFSTIMRELESLSSVDDANAIVSRRIITDHLRAATFILAEGITPGRMDQPYILRRLIRRAVRHGRKLGVEQGFTARIADVVIETHREAHPHLEGARDKITKALLEEESKFMKTIDRGEKKLLQLLGRLEEKGSRILAGEDVFELYATFGYPPELTAEMAAERGFEVDMEGFRKAFEEHQKISQAGASRKFSGGLADHSEEVTKLHTATHLLHAALRRVLGDHVFQKGSNITAERLRFDFSHPEKMTKEQIREVERLVNEQIERALPVECEEMTLEEARASGALGLFDNKYGEKVKVYPIGDFSKEICGGPHVKNTAELECFKILKEQSAAAGIRRIKAVVGEKARARM